MCVLYIYNSISSYIFILKYCFVSSIYMYRYTFNKYNDMGCGYECVYVIM